jgi:transcription initiation factor IIE alpha subunit
MSKQLRYYWRIKQDPARYRLKQLKEKEYRSLQRAKKLEAQRLRGEQEQQNIHGWQQGQ